MVLSFTLRISSAWMRMSVAWPSKPPRGWWMMTLELGRAKRLPLVPPASRMAAMEAAWPMQMVTTSFLMKRMVS